MCSQKEQSIGNIPLTNIKRSQNNSQKLNSKYNSRVPTLYEQQLMKNILPSCKQARQFRAQPLPDGSCSGVPEKKVKPPTQAAPFSVAERGAKQAEEWSKKVSSSVCKLGAIPICFRPRYISKHISRFSIVSRLFFSFTHGCFRADNHRYVPLYKRHNKSFA